MILLFLTVIPSLLWDAGPETAPVLEKAGIQQIATTGGAGAWSATKVKAEAVDAARLVKLDPPGVDYQLGRGGATSAPWVQSNLWRLMKERGKSFLYEVSGPALALAAAEAYVGGAPAYFRVKPEDLAAFAAVTRFLREIDGPPLPPRANFGLVDDGSPEMEEVVNLLIRRNLLFALVHSPSDWQGTTVRLGAPGYTKELAADPYKFAAVVRSRIGDDQRLVRLYGSETVIAQVSGTQQHTRVHLLEYGRNSVQGLRVRVLGHFRRVVAAIPGQRVAVLEDVSMDAEATEFSLPDFRTYAVVDLDAAPPETLTSTYSDGEFPLTADPAAPHWSAAAPVRITRDVFGQPLSLGPTEVRSRWTRDSVYLLYTCPFRQLYLKPGPVTDRETPVLWDWDVAEAFIGADFEHIGQYREYQVSPQGEYVDLDIDVVNPKPDGGIGWNSGFEVKARIDQASKVWYGEMRIPLASIAQRQFHAGDRLRLGLFRITGPPPDTSYVAWQPSFRRNYHVPEAFGSLVLQTK